MTVCVAVMCNQGSGDLEDSVIVGVSDRMLTVGARTPHERSFEPNQHKFLNQTIATAAMIAGSTEMLGSVLRRWQSRVDAMPSDDWASVEALAQTYAEEYGAECARRTELAVLRPRGLTLNEYNDGSKKLRPSLVRAVEDEIRNFRRERQVSGDTCLFVGLDAAGAHIYRVAWDCIVRCCDHGGFAAAGSGESFASEYLQKLGHTHRKPLTEALLSGYGAKKRAEDNSSYVGPETDVFIIGPGLRWGCWALSSEQLVTLKRIHASRASQATKISRTEALVGNMLGRGQATP